MESESNNVVPVNGNEDQYAHLRTLSTSILIERMRMAQIAGITFEGLRDEYKIFGYDRLITNQMYRNEYERGGIAGRIVDVFPNATWRGGFELIEDADPNTETAFEKAWLDLEKKHKLKGTLLRVDKLAGLSSYAALLIGAPGDLKTELPKARKPGSVLFFEPFAGGGGPGIDNRGSTIGNDADCSVKEYEDNPQNARFGLPRIYQLRRKGVSAEGLREVHWTRILHVAENLLDDNVFGQPALERVWNLLIDLRKVTGGGAEAFWLRANQGMQINLDKDMALAPAGPDGKTELDKLREQADEYQHQIRRVLRTRGVNIEMLGSDVANFANPADAILTQIAGSKGIPKRILTGSEMGELASTQDRENWKDQVVGRQTNYAAPFIIRPLVDRLIEYGYLPAPAKDAGNYEVKWSQIETLTSTEKAAGAQSWAQTNATQGSIVFPEEEIRDHWYGKDPLTDEQREEIAKRQIEKLKQAQEMIKATSPAAPIESDDEETDDEEQPRPGFPRAARAKEGPLHKIADRHQSKFQKMMAHAIDAARIAVGRKSVDVDKVIAAFEGALSTEKLKQLILTVIAEGGTTAAKMLTTRRRAAQRNLAKRPIRFKFNHANEHVVDWADKHAAELVTRISETTRESLNNAIAEALEGDGIEAAYDSILEAIGDKTRAELIARHESMIAASEGQRQAWSQATEEGYLTGNEKRTWIIVGDDNVCDICEELDGRTAELGGSYDDGIEGPPAHVACRCTEGLV